MLDNLAPIFTEWESYYVIVGSSAAALTGLQFVVIALVADSRIKSTPEAVDAFGTPTVVHFCAALFVSALLSAPWHSLGPVAHILAAEGLFGLVYSVLVMRRARRQSNYKPVFEDWFWHAALPFVSYAFLFGAALTLVHRETASLFAIAGVALLLLLVGIHNAWDSVTYVAVQSRRQGQEGQDSESTPASTPAASPEQPSGQSAAQKPPA
jgi:hypothetical protein